MIAHDYTRRGVLLLQKRLHLLPKSQAFTSAAIQHLKKENTPCTAMGTESKTNSSLHAPYLEEVQGKTIVNCL